MKRFLAATLFAMFACASFAPASAQVYSGESVRPSGLCSYVTVGYATPCSPAVGDKPFFVSATTTLTKFISGAAGTTIRFTYVQYAAIESATGGALEFESGTGTNCGTGTAVLTSLAWVGTTAVNGSYGSGNSAIFIAPAGSDVCAIVSAGTVTSAIASGTYAQY